MIEHEEGPGYPGQTVLLHHHAVVPPDVFNQIIHVVGGTWVPDRSSVYVVLIVHLARIKLESCQKNKFGLSGVCFHLN